ncbi:hypothetical protein RUM43_008505 [Polyplax serrata]|uniref:Homeotic protein spalt-major n=1 Tax=Polyplax serrata TaxID=468196 RepID=A0AAN8P9F6_POLSC
MAHPMAFKPIALSNKATSEIESSPPHVCCHCHLETSSMVDLLEHQKNCNSKYDICNGDQSDAEDGVAYGDEEEFINEGEKRQEVVRRQRQDVENNNSVEGEEGEKENDLSLGFPFSIAGVPGHVTLEALQNTKVAVAQFAATALATNGDNPAALQELAVLQSTLFTLQQQQMMQLSLIQQLQNHLTVHPKDEGPTSPIPSSNKPASTGILVPATPLVQQTSAKPLRIPTPGKTDNSSLSPPASQSMPASHKQQQQSFDHQPLTIPKPPVPMGSPLQSSPPTSATHSSLGSISSSLASSIITNNDPPPSLNEPNTLEMLQKRAQEVLDNASQGLLANNLADELAFRKNGKNSLSPLSGGRNEPFFKHRCRYCGKVFGSDSALQIHIRSHTGERPFKCNVCGSRFTTKGNLKVHFQRHTSKFPHIKMNPNPVPEHLDKYHPPLLAQMNNQNLAPGLPPQQTHGHPHRPSPHYPFTSSPTFPTPTLPLFRPPLPHDLIPRSSTVLTPVRSHESNLLKPLIPLPMFAPRDEQDTPENLSKPQNRSVVSPDEMEEIRDRYKDRSRTPSPSEPMEVDDSNESNHQAKNTEQGAKDVEQGDGEGDGDKSSINCNNSSNRNQQESCNRNSGSKIENLENDCMPADEDLEGNVRKNQKVRLSPEKEVQSECERLSGEGKAESQKAGFARSPHSDECSVDSKYSDEDILDESFDRRNSMDGDKSEDQLENLSSKSPALGHTSETTSHRTTVKTFPSAGSPHSSNSSGSNNFSVHIEAGSTSQEIDPAKDPAIYNSLLPRPGSNDNSWESLIEVTKTSETYKLQQLVDNIEHKLTDPNQCVICHRVLSCKSALQMHYRTHTGERPFRCKICGRAFTTKGNLKTHMGVHRLKPPMRVLHQCPVCHKKFTNALVLQQHIRLHTGEPTDLTPEQIHAAEIKEFSGSGPFPQPNFLSHGFPITGLPPTGLHLGIRSEYDREIESKDDHEEDLFDEDDDEFSSSSESQPINFPTFPSSISAIENQVRTMVSQFPTGELNRSAEDLSLNKMGSPTFRMNGVKSPGSPTPGPGSPNDSDYRGTPSPTTKDQTPLNVPRPSSSRTPSSPANSESNSLGALDLTPRSATVRSSPGPPQTGIFSSLGLIPAGGPSPLMTSALSSLTSSVLTSTAFSPLGMAVGPAVRGNTTCNICFKTFACNSALEIHYRSHTKERPFKCTICDRGFSTKVGNAGVISHFHQLVQTIIK